MKTLPKICKHFFSFFFSSVYVVTNTFFLFGTVKAIKDYTLTYIPWVYFSLCSSVRSLYTRFVHVISTNRCQILTNTVYNCNNNNQGPHAISNHDYTPGSKFVVNLSDFTLNEYHHSVLSKGLNFCPTPGEPDLASYRADLDTFHRQLRLQHFFRKFEDNETSSQNTQEMTLSAIFYPDDEAFNHQDFKPKSRWRPPPGPPTLEAMALSNEMALQFVVPRSPHNQNLSKNEKIALRELEKNNNIVIKAADKGSAIVIQNKTDYIQEALRQLGNKSHYVMSQNDLSDAHMSQITNQVQIMFDNGEISEACKAFLTDFKHRTSRFYLLPKIHKNILPPPGRPIISGNGCPTERISQFVDFFIRDLSKLGKSFVRDTTHLLQLVNKIHCTPSETLLVTLDVTGLYTNIPNSEGIRSVHTALNKYRLAGVNPSNASILRLLRMVLTMNNFEFNGSNYLQVGGTAMGTKTAPNYAILFMNNFEDNFVYTYEKQPQTWLRYIDDIFMVWQHGEDELTKFIHHLNNCHATIKFTHDYSNHEVNFLDTTIFSAKDGCLHTKLYSKPTDTHMYLHFDSSHPQHCKTSLPYSQLLRVKRICSSIEDYTYYSKILLDGFRTRNYPEEILSKAISQVSKIPRDTLLVTKQKTVDMETTNLYATSTFHPGFNSFRKTIETNWQYLARNKATKHIYDKKVLFGYRRPKTIGNHLVRAKISTETTPTIQNNCKGKTCLYCAKLAKCSQIKDKYSKRRYNVRRNISCQSNNLIYGIQCKTCLSTYVGQTQRKLRDRLYEHFRDIKSCNLSRPVGNHFSSKNHHNGLNDVSVYVLAFSRLPPTDEHKYFRETLEKQWQFRLHTHHPLGLNLEDESPW